MMLSVRKTTIALASCAVIAAAGVPAALAQSGSSDSSDNSSQTSKPPRRGHRPPPRFTAAQLEKVAKALDVSADQLKDAMNKARATAKAGDRRPSPREMDAAIAKELGKTAEQVHAAFASVRSARDPGGPCPDRPASGSNSNQGSDYPSNSGTTTQT